MTDTLRTISIKHPKAPQLQLTVGQSLGTTRVEVSFPREQDEPYVSLELSEFEDLFGEAIRIAERVNQSSGS